MAVLDQIERKGEGGSVLVLIYFFVLPFSTFKRVNGFGNVIFIVTNDTLFVYWPIDARVALTTPNDFGKRSIRIDPEV
jgi:hypothetical protein